MDQHSTRFLANTLDHIVSGAADGVVRHTVLRPHLVTSDSNLATNRFNYHSTSNARKATTFPTARGVTITAYRCHRGMVHEVPGDPSNACLFFSASEDGTIRQFDTRARHTCAASSCG